MSTTTESTRPLDSAVPAAPQAPVTFEGERRVVLRGITWEGFLSFCDLIGDQAGVRISYDGEDLELMGPSYDHEVFSGAMEFLVPEVAGEFEIPCRSVRSTLFRSEAIRQGKEADAYFYVARAHLVAGRPVDPKADPAPDLAIEVEITNPLVPSLPILAALKVTEVWRLQGTAPHFLHLQDDGTYLEQPASRLLPMIRPGDIGPLLEQARTMDTVAWRRAVRNWIRDVLAPREHGRRA